jgi:N-acetylmuramic acid 6-phosphate etherase
MFVAVEGAEDSAPQGAADLCWRCSPRPDDVVLLLAASGSTPYAWARCTRRARPAR